MRLSTARRSARPTFGPRIWGFNGRFLRWSPAGNNVARPPERVGPWSCQVLNAFTWLFGSFQATLLSKTKVKPPEMALGCSAGWQQQIHNPPKWGFYPKSARWNRKGAAGPRPEPLAFCWASRVLQHPEQKNYEVLGQNLRSLASAGSGKHQILKFCTCAGAAAR